MQYRVKKNSNNPDEYIPPASLGEILVDLQTRRVYNATPGKRHEEVRGGSRPIDG